MFHSPRSAELITESKKNNYGFIGSDSLAKLEIEVKNETCPVPLVETRKALRKANPGDIVVITGTHPPSKKEIPMAVNALGSEIIDIKEEGEVWTIKIKK